MGRSFENRFTAVFTQDRLDRIRQHLDGIRTELADTLELTEEDIREYYKTAEEEELTMREIHALAALLHEHFSFGKSLFSILMIF
ncbi:MAG: hypothetical protein OHK0019_28200 [Saprospiraceae bacterium]